MKKLIIYRAKWRCGARLSGPNIYSHGRGPTCLLNKEGFMCCLGSRCLVEGFSEAEIQNIDEPAELYVPEDHKPWALLARSDDILSEWVNTTFASKAIDINDNAAISNKTREQRLIALAKEHNEEWEFVGEFGD